MPILRGMQFKVKKQNDTMVTLMAKAYCNGTYCPFYSQNLCKRHILKLTMERKGISMKEKVLNNNEFALMLQVPSYALSEVKKTIREAQDKLLALREEPEKLLPELLFNDYTHLAKWVKEAVDAEMIISKVPYEFFLKREGLIVGVVHTQTKDDKTIILDNVHLYNSKEQEQLNQKMN